MTAVVILTGGLGWMLAATLAGIALFGITAVVTSRRDHRRTARDHHPTRRSQP